MSEKESALKCLNTRETLVILTKNAHIYSYGNARQKLFYAWDFFLVWMACKFSVAINTLLNFMYPMSFYKLGDHILFIFPIQAQT